MADIDPDTLLEWLTMGAGEERDTQLVALEQLCMLLLMSDNVDRCFERLVFFLMQDIVSKYCRGDSVQKFQTFLHLSQINCVPHNYVVQSQILRIYVFAKYQTTKISPNYDKPI